MKRRVRLWLVLALLLLVGASFLHPAVYWRVVGWAKGEAFYDGRPTSYWSQDLRDFNEALEIDIGTLPLPPKPSLMDQLRSHFGMKPVGFAWPKSSFWNAPEAIPVLIELTKDQDPGVRYWAKSFLAQIDPETAVQAKMK